MNDAFGELIAFQRALKDLVSPYFKHLEMVVLGLKEAVEQIMSLLLRQQLASLVAWAVWKELWQNVIILDLSFVVAPSVFFLSAV